MIDDMRNHPLEVLKYGSLSILAVSVAWLFFAFAYDLAFRFGLLESPDTNASETNSNETAGRDWSDFEMKWEQWIHYTRDRAGYGRIDKGSKIAIWKVERD